MKKPRNNFSRPLTVLLSVFAFAVAAFVLLPFWPVSIPEGGGTFTVKQGSGLQRLAVDLGRAGIAPVWVVRFVAWQRGSAKKLQAGEYVLDSPRSISELLSSIESGDARRLAVTIVEGSRLNELIEHIAETEEGKAGFSDANAVDEKSLATLLAIPEGSAEGYLFPDTYFVAPGSSAAALAKLMHKRMQDELSKAWEQRAADTPLKSPYEALILASIIEKETGREADRPLVGSVFVNRLKIGMRLQTDPAVIYGMGDKYSGSIRKVDLQTDTPYNTYTRNGLPPTPIAFPGRASLRAAVNPPPSEFIYFVARGDGTSEFSRNLAEHNRAVSKFIRGGD